MHIAGELVGRFLKERCAFQACCLNADAAVLTAWSNDYSYERVFARQLEAHAQPGAVLIGLSTSGNSANGWKRIGLQSTSGLRRSNSQGRAEASLRHFLTFFSICLSCPRHSFSRHAFD